MEAFGAQGAVDSLLGMLASVIRDEARLLGGVRGEVQFIKDEMESMYGFLLQVDEASEDNEHQVHAWMRQVRDVAVDSERWVARYQRWTGAAPRGTGLLDILRRIPYTVWTVRERRKIATRVQELKARAQEVGDRRQRYGVKAPQAMWRPELRPLLEDEAEEQADYDRRRCLQDHKEPDITDEDKGNLIRWLTEEDASLPRLRLIRVLGIRELGTQRLKREVFENAAVASRFDCRSWISVEPDKDTSLVPIVEQIVEQLVRDLEQQQGPQIVAGTVEDKVSHHLKDRRFLIVWEGIKDPTTWAVLDTLLRSCGCPDGNAMIKITQDKSNSESYHGTMDKNTEIIKFYKKNATELLRRNPYNGLDPWPMLAPIIEKLAPDYFAVKMLLHTICVTHPRRMVEELRLLSSELSSGQGPTKTRSVLRFCYYCLSAECRRCLLYLSIFPPGWKMRRTILVGRWVAEGLILGRAGLSALAAAERCFRGLVDRGLLCHVDRFGTDGKVKGFTVPDPVLDFITKTARADNFSNLPPGLAPHLSIGTGIDALQQVPKRGNICTKILRSICSSENDGVPTQEPDIIALLECLPTHERQGLLKVLDLEGCTGLREHHLKIICQMQELRYLSLRSTDVIELPKEIRKLQNLETLDIRQTKVKVLPAKTFLLQKLKHLLSGHIEYQRQESADVMGSNELFTAVDMPHGIGNMTEMQILSHVEVSDDSDKLIDEFARLQKLRKLGLVLREQTEPYHHLRNLLRAVEKLNKHLRSLSVQIEPSPIADGHQTIHGAAINMIALPTYLENIKMSGFGEGLPSCVLKLNQLVKVTLKKSLLKNSDIRTLSMLASLRLLRFRYIDSCEQDIEDNLVLKKHEFRNLKSLYLEHCIIADLSFEEGAASKLEKMVWSYSSRMINSISGINHLTRLNTIDFYGSRVNDQVKQAVLAHPSPIKACYYYENPQVPQDDPADDAAPPGV